MTELSQVFLLFYAVLYGALFTITDKWRPVMGTFSGKGLKRLVASFVFYGLAPVGYFVMAFMQLERLSRPTCLSLSIPLAILCVVPLVLFHFWWIWWVVPRRDSYCESAHLEDPTLHAAVEWTDAGRYEKLLPFVLAHVLLLAIPLTVLFFILPHLQTTCR